MILTNIFNKFSNNLKNFREQFSNPVLLEHKFPRILFLKNGTFLETLPKSRLTKIETSLQGKQASIKSSEKHPRKYAY